MDLMSRRRAMLSLVQSGGELPSEYAELPYIFGDGRQTIITNIAPSETDIITVDSQLLDLSDNCSILGSGNGGVFNAIYCTRNEQVFAVQFGAYLSGAYVYTSFAKDTNRHTFILNAPERTFSIDSSSFSLESLRYSVDDSNYSLFFINDNNSHYSVEKYYGVIIAGKLKLIPCIRKSDGEIGVYDIVQNIFFTNSGFGKFHQNPLYTTPYSDDACVATGASSRTFNTSIGSISYNNGVFTLTRTNNAAGLVVIMGLMEANETYNISGTFGNIDGKMYIAKVNGAIRPSYSSTRKATKTLQSGATDFIPTETGLYEFLVWNNGTNPITAQDIRVTKIS